MPNKASDAWHKGYDAGANRDPESSNPYREGPLYHQWLDGWRTGIDPDRDERERD